MFTGTSLNARLGFALGVISAEKPFKTDAFVLSTTGSLNLRFSALLFVLLSVLLLEIAIVLTLMMSFTLRSDLIE